VLPERERRKRRCRSPDRRPALRNHRRRRATASSGAR
jgi:hypothetical protein